MRSLIYVVAGGGYGLSVYGKQFQSRMEALTVALGDLKAKMGSSDTTNDKQPIIPATIPDIDKIQLNMLQISLF